MTTPARLCLVPLLLASCASSDKAASEEPSPTPKDVRSVTGDGLERDSLEKEAGTRAPEVPSSGPGSAEVREYLGTVLVDPPKPDAVKKSAIRVVWLAVADDEKYVLSYLGPRSPFSVFDGQEVRVRGYEYEPEHQALINPHLEVEKMQPKTLSSEHLWETIGPKLEACLPVSVFTHPKGVKSAGERDVRVEIAGTSYDTRGLDLSEAGSEKLIRYRLVSPNPGFSPKEAIAMRMPGVTAWVAETPRACTER